MLLTHLKTYLEKNAHSSSAKPTSDHAVSEYQLLEQLKPVPALLEIEESCRQQPALLLFRKHFTLMNALYQLQRDYQQQGKFYLEISALKIALRPSLQPPAQGLLAATRVPSIPIDTKLADYYLNWNHYLNTTEDTVEQLLGDFWLAFSLPQKKLAAYQLLDLEVGCIFTQVEKRYRQLAAKHHPDRGGNSERFIQIREAYEVLKSCNKNHMLEV